MSIDELIERSHAMAAECHGIDLFSLCELKMAYNATRPYRHGGKRA